MQQVKKQMNTQYYLGHNSPQLAKRNTPETQMYFSKKNDYEIDAFSETNIFQEIKMNHADYLSHWLELRDKFLYYRDAFNTFNQKMIQLFQEIRSQRNGEQKFKKREFKHQREFQIHNYLSKNKFSNKAKKERISYISDSLSVDNRQMLDFNSSQKKINSQTESNPFENTLQRELRLDKELSDQKKLINEVSLRRKQELSDFNNNNLTKTQKPLFKRIQTGNEFHQNEPLFFKENLSGNLNIKKKFQTPCGAFKNSKKKTNIPYPKNMPIHSNYQYPDSF